MDLTLDTPMRPGRYTYTVTTPTDEWVGTYDAVLGVTVQDALQHAVATAADEHQLPAGTVQITSYSFEKVQ